MWIVWYMDAQIETAARSIGGGDWKWLCTLAVRAALYTDVVHFVRF